MHGARHIVAILAVAVLLVRPVHAGDVIHVDDDNCPGPGDGSAGNPFCTIQPAIDAALDGDEVVIAPGTYAGPGNVNLDFTGRLITVRSAEGPATCVIDCGRSARGFYFHSGEGRAAVVQGLTIRDGGVQFGGAIRCEESHPTIRGCIFADNGVSRGGGAIRVLGGDPAIIESVFTDNESDEDGGAIYFSSSNAVVVNCRFTANRAASGRGGAINADGGTSVTVLGCLFEGNSADSTGGAIRISASTAFTAINCTFTGNHTPPASQDGGGAAVANESGSPDLLVVNTILWGNTPDQILGDATVRYSCVEGGWAGGGPGNITENPLFGDAITGGFHLLPKSPCIDAGHSNAVAGLLAADLDGAPRFADTASSPDTGCGAPVVVDMGAFEHAGDAMTVRFGDVTGNGWIGFQDLVAIAECLGSDDPSCCAADLDVDGAVTVPDAVLLLPMLVNSLSLP